MKPFLLLQVRPETPAADNEYEAFMKFSGLKPDELKRLRVENGDVEPIDIDSYSGIILGGGPYNASDPITKKSAAQKKCEAWLFSMMDKVVERDHPFLGTCYGIGIVGVHQGGTVNREFGEDVGAVDIKLTDKADGERLLTGLPQEFKAFVGHKEACAVLPIGAILLANSVTCPVQMYRLKNNIYVTQFHTELDANGLALRVQIYKNYGYFPPEAADELIADAKKQNVIEPVKILRNFIETYTNT